MKRHYYLLTVLFVFLFVGVASAQHPMLDMVADKVVQKYQNSSCEQLWMERSQQQGKPKPEKEQEFIQILQGNPQLRTEFINRVAAPIANKMFQCGMIP
jgi:transcriptional regulator GlxA family with amidase domain